MAETAQRVVREAGAETVAEKILALRDFVRRRVTWSGATYARTKPLRDSASEVLLSGKGYCGEDSRLFVCLANALGIRAQRVNLYGVQPHVVAEVDLLPGETILVDCQNPPTIGELENLDRVMAENRYGYTDYSTLNLERFRLLGLLRRVHLRMGYLGLWLESPHRIMATVYALLALIAGLGVFRSILRHLAGRQGERAASGLDGGWKRGTEGAG